MSSDDAYVVLPRTVRAGDDLQEVAVGVLEVHPAATVVVVDLTPVCEPRIGPVILVASLDAAKDLVELVLGDQKGVVLRKDLTVEVVEVVVVERNPLSISTIMNGPQGIASPSPSISVTYRAEICLSRHQTIAWFNITLILRLLHRVGPSGVPVGVDALCWPGLPGCSQPLLSKRSPHNVAAHCRWIPRQLDIWCTSLGVELSWMPGGWGGPGADCAS